MATKEPREIRSPFRMYGGEYDRDANGEMKDFRMNVESVDHRHEAAVNATPDAADQLAPMYAHPSTVPQTAVSEAQPAPEAPTPETPAAPASEAPGAPSPDAEPFPPAPLPRPDDPRDAVTAPQVAPAEDYSDDVIPVV